MKATLRQIRLTPKKANVIATVVRKMPADKALETLKYMPKKGADILYKVLHSAVANAEKNFGVNPSDLYIQHVYITPGMTLKRGQSRSRGRVFPLKKRTSHITVHLTRNQ